MTAKIRRSKLVICAIASVLGLSAAGCSMDDVQFNGGVFDMVGLSDSSREKTKSGDPKLAERPPLVVPPALDRLPPPVEEDQSPQITGIKDPDKEKSASKAALEQEQAEYCEKNYEIPKRMGDASADSAEGPLGPCRPSALNALKNWSSSEE